MDRNRFSIIAHRNHAFSNPVNETKMMNIIRKVQLKSQDRVLDIGAGMCELLIRLVENYKISGVAIELYGGAIDEAKRQASGRIPDGCIEFIVDDANAAVENCEQDGFELGVCIGSTHALGGLESTLEKMKRLVKKDGYILIGEGYWKQRPSAAYLEALGGASETDLKSHADNVKVAEALGLVPIWSYAADDNDWDEYEWLYSSSIENYCHENPDDPDRDAMLERIRSWRRTYLQWGRDTLGFGLYLFRK